MLGTVGGPQGGLFLEVHGSVVGPLTVQCTKSGLNSKGPKKIPKKTVLLLAMLTANYIPYLFSRYTTLCSAESVR